MGIATLKINLSSISKNWIRLQALSNSTVETAAVLKANAYGLGIGPVSEHLFLEGARTFFVSTVDEAVALRQILLPEAKIYYLNGYSISDYDAVREYKIMPVLNSLDQIKNFNSIKTQKIAAVQIDVGMNRLGLSGFEILKAVANCKSINLNLILGHLSSANDKSDPKNLKQLALFIKLSKFFKNIPKSLAATGGTLLGTDYHFDLTRPGIGIFGGKPLENAAPVVTIDLPILQIKDIKKNQGIGYNHTYISNRPRKIAIVASGYADGLCRQLSNTGMLYANNTKCPILGRVSMDLITVDVSDLTIIPKTLSAVGPNQTIDDLGFQSKTIGYEILTSLGSRYKRVYHS